MTSPVCRFFVFLLALSGCITQAGAQEGRKPLTDTELLALVAGNALSENVVHQIESRGLTFRPSDAYRSQLTTAGADPRVLDALSKARINLSSVTAGNNTAPELLQHLALAGKLMRSNQFQQATEELNAALQSGGGPEAGFVMGELLRLQEQWPMAAAIYQEVLQKDPGFPEAQTKLSYILYHVGDPEEALRQAKAALTRTPQNAEAHMNAGVALNSLRKFDAVEAEYREALRLKPDYERVHYDLAISLSDKGDKDGAITEYRKALALNPKDVNARYNMANELEEKGDIASAIREFREAKRLDPDRFDVRMNLSSAFLRGNFNGEAVAELRELEVMFPDSAMCHQALGHALHLNSDFKGAEKELRKAAELDPSDPAPHLSLGAVQEDQKNYDAALEEYRKAEDLDENSAHAHRNIGRIMLLKKDTANALKELKQAEALAPSEAYIHELYGQALQMSGSMQDAASQFKVSLSLDPKQTEVRLELAAALEKNGDWVAALDQYRRASLADANIDLGNHIMRVISPSPQDQLKAAQLRFSRHLAALKAAGKSEEAAKLKSSVAASQTVTESTEKLDAAMQAGFNALRSGQFSDALQNYKEAVDFGEKLQPHDGRLVVALGELGKITLGLQQFPEAAAIFQRQMKVTEEVYGTQSPMLTEPLQNLGREALLQHDYVSAKSFFTHALELNEKIYGDNSKGAADSIRMMATLYFVQGDFAKAEPFLLRAVKIDETLYGHDGIEALINLNMLCTLYDRWDKPEKSEPCDLHLLAISEKQYGPDSAYLLPTLTSRAQALRKLGRADEAAKLEQRIKSIQASAMNQQ